MSWLGIKVDVWEYERGWGRRLDFTRYFEIDKMLDAIAYTKEFNSGNTSRTAPDWYMQANDPVVVDRANKP